jgi:hypothetical protein
MMATSTPANAATAIGDGFRTPQPGRAAGQGCPAQLPLNMPRFAAYIDVSINNERR